MGQDSHIWNLASGLHKINTSALYTHQQIFGNILSLIIQIVNNDDSCDSIKMWASKFCSQLRENKDATMHKFKRNSQWRHGTALSENLKLLDENSAEITAHTPEMHSEPNERGGQMLPARRS